MPSSFRKSWTYIFEKANLFLQRLDLHPIAFHFLFSFVVKGFCVPLSFSLCCQRLLRSICLSFVKSFCVPHSFLLCCSLSNFLCWKALCSTFDFPLLLKAFVFRFHFSFVKSVCVPLAVSLVVKSFCVPLAVSFVVKKLLRSTFGFLCC